MESEKQYLCRGYTVIAQNSHTKYQKKMLSSVSDKKYTEQFTKNCLKGVSNNEMKEWVKTFFPSVVWWLYLNFHLLSLVMKALASSAVLNNVSADHWIAGPRTLWGLSRGELFFLDTNDENWEI